VMDYVHGETVSRLIKATKRHEARVPIDIAVRVVSDALLGLHAAHEAKDEQGAPLGLVHRDVSPQNIMVGADGVSRVLDFGVAKARGVSRTTSAGGIKGKLGYMPPEQLYGERVDRRADIYATGVVLWEMLTCERLFAGEDGDASVGKALTLLVPRPSLRNEEVPDELDELVLRALHRERSQRFDTAQSMAEALVAAVTPAPPSKVAAWVDTLAGKALAERANMVADIEAAPDESGTGAARDAHKSLLGGMAEESVASQLERRRVRRTRAAALVTAGLLVATGAWFVWKSQETKPVEPPATVSSAVVAGTDSAVESAAPFEPPPPSASTSTAPPYASKKPSVTRPPRPRGTTVKPSPPATVNCAPPYTLDANGHKHYKRECLR